MPFQLTALRTRVARRILGLFIVCAFVPIGTLAVLSYRRVSVQLTQQATQRLHEISKGAGMVLMKRLTDLDDELGAAAEQVSSWPAARRTAGGGGNATPRSPVPGSRDSYSSTPVGAIRAFAGDSTPPPALARGWAPDAARGRAAPPDPRFDTRVARAGGRSPRLAATRCSGPTSAASALWSIDRTDEVLPAGTSLCILSAARQPLHCPAGVPPPLLDAAPPTMATGFPLLTWRRGR